MTAVPAEDGVFGDVPETVYHGDLGSLSCSSAKALLKSPYKFHWSRTQPRVQKSYFDLGHYVHGKALGVGEPVAILDYPDFKTKAAREERDQAYAEGKVPILTKDAALGDAMVAALLGHETAGELLAAPDAVEHSAYWHDPLTHVRLRSRFDLFSFVDDWLLIADVKTTSVTADPRAWGGAVAAKTGLHIQDAWYRTAAAATGLAPDPERIDFVFINVETEPPHMVSVTRLPSRAVRVGAQKMRAAVDLFAKCTRSDVWPSYGPGITTVEMPNYFYYQEEE
ncbi:uncharacterized protein RMCC_5821 [Mycolicibacterium canariasense]|uniref:Putative exodeoxyribonuclease 8 PDDEXK-like domain-containing protein n=1 Tax=Mycolicibacterium canariasense TaxID=228230 RepID=A0A100WID5_MYCCR|nr:PD-(D/E)XK nuclease-like domain-containing protein [Mycolicibacterium canariasense]MCV7210198.1 PD-(D/E)XK nuclease-like domain-containing protein [Mycolicibacterium canariasense]ORU98469.1 hypothetical protein AWB94_28410 [Mycolicibacterium canariasense]GAS98856.1 uncharacterized protein RMCC_5821 [Mycolicibacterium canariasense]